MKKTFFLLVLAGTVSSFAPPKKALTWVAIGDSITYLNEHPDETGNKITRGYLSGVVKKLPYIHYLNQGHNGWTSGDIAKSIDQLGLQKADVYTVFLGTNDWWQGHPLGNWNDYANATGNGTIYGSFRIILDKLHSLNDKAPIILITPMQRADFVYISDNGNNAYGSYEKKNGQSLEQFAEAIRTIGDHGHFKVVDLYHKKGLSLPHLVRYKRLKDPETGSYRNYPYPDFIGVPFHPGTDEYPYPAGAVDMTYDGLHPSDKGFEVITGMLVKIMRKL